MFNSRYFNSRYFNDRYFNKAGADGGAGGTGFQQQVYSKGLTRQKAGTAVVGHRMKTRIVWRLRWT